MSVYIEMLIRGLQYDSKVLSELNYESLGYIDGAAVALRDLKERLRTTDEKYLKLLDDHVSVDFENRKLRQQIEASQKQEHSAYVSDVDRHGDVKIIDVDDLEKGQLLYASQVVQVQQSGDLVIGDCFLAGLWSHRNVDAMIADGNVVNQVVPVQQEAIKKAIEFIENGIDFGFIRMPDVDTPDSAHKVLPMLKAALLQPHSEDKPSC